VFWDGAVPAGLAVGFALYVVGPLLGGLIMFAKGRSVGAGLLVAALVPIIGHIALLGLENRA
jgi:VIT1/CCC1 family predicted Fe2+/Mn2+ transporter